MVFISKKDTIKANPDITVARNYGHTVKKGEVGIEVEVEGRKLPRTDLPVQWAYHEDGSLRGQENAEYVLRKPLPFGEVDKAVDDLWELFTKTGSKLDESNRTSVHVHLNVGPFYLNRLVSLMALWFTFEDLLTHWCGEHRVGNLFCLRAKDSHNIITTLRKYVQSNMKSSIKDNHHYACLNANALGKFGSLEFRPLRGVTDPDVLKSWVRILKKIYDASEGYKDPRRLCEQFSQEGPTVFMESIFGEEVGTIRRFVTWSDEQITDNLYEGIRLAQELCYARDWDDFSPVETKKDPFGRDYEPAPTALRGPVTIEEAGRAQIRGERVEHRRGQWFIGEQIVINREPLADLGWAQFLRNEGPEG